MVPASNQVEASEGQTGASGPEAIREFSALVASYDGDPTFAGGWVENDRFVLSFTTSGPDLADIMANEAVIAMTEIRTKPLSLADLRQQQGIVESLLRPNGEIAGVALDIRNNGLLVVTNDEPQARTALTGLLVAPVTLVVGSNSDGGCSNRTNCGGSDVRRAGVAINRGGASCSAGFVVVKNGTRYGTTAGHCWYGEAGGGLTSGTEAYGALNSSNTYGQGSFCDCRLITFTSGDPSGPYIYYTDLFKRAAVYGGASTPVPVGISVQLNGANTSSQGQVEYVDYTYTSETCGCILYGATLADYVAVGGDSGAPIHGLIAGQPGSNMIAKGMHSGQSAGFGRFYDSSDVMEFLDVSIVSA